MAQVETGVKKKIDEELAELPPLRLWSTPTGQFFRYTKEGVLKPCTIGFSGLADKTGYYSMTITPEMVGMNVAVFLVIEAKKPKTKASAEGKLKQGQFNFLEAARKAGALAFLVRTMADLKPLKEEQTCRQHLIKSAQGTPVEWQSVAREGKRKSTASRMSKASKPLPKIR